MNETIVYRPAGEKCHFYSRLGEPVWELPNKSKGGMRPVTLADAKKLDLLPSVTTAIRGGRPQPYGVLNYKMEQFGQHLLTSPRQPEENDADFLDRVNTEYQAAMDAAPDIGTDVHAMIAEYLRHGPETVTALFPESSAAFGKVKTWIDVHVQVAEFVELAVAAPGLGYAGTADALLHMDSGQNWLVDWKTQGVKDKPKTYEEWVIQLAALSKLLADYQIDVVANLVIPTSDYPTVTEALWTPAELEWGWRAFQLALDSYRHTNRWPLTTVVKVIA